LTKTKTASRGARLQSAVIRDKPLLRALTLVCGGLPANVAICPGGVRGFTQRFDLLARALRIDDLFSPGGLRGGGAIHFFAHTPNLGELQFAGRWEASSSLRHYLQHVLSVEAWLDMSAVAKQRALFWASLGWAVHQDVEQRLLGRE